MKSRDIQDGTTSESMEEELESSRMLILQLERELAERDLQILELSGVHDYLDQQHEKLETAQETLELEHAAHLEANALLKRSAEIASLGYAVWDEILDRDVTVSEELARIHGFTKEDYIATITSLESYIQYVHPEDQELYREHMTDPEAYKNNTGVDYRFITPDGDTRYLHDRSQYLPVATGEPTHSIVVVQDITELKMREIELNNARHKADAANRIKSTFLANMSHEIRTPMNGVLAMAELLLEGDLSDRQRKKVETIQQSGDMLMTVLNDILDVSKIEAEKLTLEEVEFDLGNIVKSVAELGRLEVRQKDLKIHVNVEGLHCPNLIGDPNRVRQILTNLTNNAIKFTTKGSITLAIDQKEIDESTIETRIEVVDTGIGISDEALGSLFDEFYQADLSTTRQYGGSGLGLAICKSLTELMGGMIGARSPDQGGSLFWISIPFRVGSR